MANKRKRQNSSHRGSAPQPEERAYSRPESYTNQTNSGPMIRPELVDAEAQAEAEKCQQVSETQMRRFFGDAKAKQIGSENLEAKVLMAILKARAHYAAARDPKNKPLASFFDHHAKLIKTVCDFGHFMQHFEAVIAYHKFKQKQ